MSEYDELLARLGGLVRHWTSLEDVDVIVDWARENQAGRGWPCMERLPTTGETWGE